ncbi:MAG: hypothetical protein LBK57_03065 [Clostridiales Family XIII bacterium]|jgi:hypothetical protein|nr:hypothetical protein [Clostridiales Family XIII bacterium]
MKSIKRLFAALLALAVIAACTPAAFADNIDGITFTDPDMFSYTYVKGEPVPIIQLVVEGYTNDPQELVPLDHPEDVTWLSTDDSVVRIDESGFDSQTGTAYARINISTSAAGEAYIFAYYNDEPSVYEVRSHIVVTPIAGITFTDQNMALNVFAKDDVAPIIHLVVEGYTNVPQELVPLDNPQNVTWYSTDPSVVSIATSGYDSPAGTAYADISINTAAAGQADVYAYYVDGFSSYEVNSHILVTPVAGITFTDPNMFAYTFDVDDEVPPIALEVKGYKNNPQMLVPLDAPEKVIWYSTNENIAVVTPYGSAGGAAYAIVDVDTSAEGEADIYAHYADDYALYEVYSHIVVEAPAPPEPVEDITLTVKFSPGKSQDNFTLTLNEVPYFSLKDVFGQQFSDSAVMKDHVTALHALLWGLESHFNPSFDGENWEWVPDDGHVIITSNGAYVDTINGDVNNWVYTVDGKYPGAACQTPLAGGEPEVWTFLGSLKGASFNGFNGLE